MLLTNTSLNVSIIYFIFYFHTTVEIPGIENPPEKNSYSFSSIVYPVNRYFSFPGMVKKINMAGTGTRLQTVSDSGAPCKKYQLI